MTLDLVDFISNDRWDLGPYFRQCYVVHALRQQVDRRVCLLILNTLKTPHRLSRLWRPLSRTLSLSTLSGGLLLLDIPHAPLRLLRLLEVHCLAESNFDRNQLLSAVLGKHHLQIQPKFRNQ